MFPEEFQPIIIRDSFCDISVKTLLEASVLSCFPLIILG